ncbi:hypothetical protein [Agrobacterium bohemicum]|uniref:Thymidylate synthase/dCMP hydroxymethylase domain-containing protein n=1 Tax=Agrobacterium bohemicum TaxID=2052828 RepID=A0A135P855_9HYPH|nr:hypothetical protein [Agrobacterium bohemicum]KXG87603.1 hypothetical protein ATO67_18320 [Agrobacterium bohemicum]
MILLKNSEIGQVWLEYIQSVLSNGEWVFDNREEIFETTSICFTISEFDDVNGILSRHSQKKIIELYTRKMFSTEIIEELNSTYGDRFFNNIGVNQFELAVKKLKENKYAKSVFIPLVVPNDPGPRIPCLSAVQVAIRHGELVMFATFRSQNVFNSYGNFLGLKELSVRFATELNVASGPINFFVNFPHIYRSDVPRCQGIISAETTGDKT